MIAKIITTMPPITPPTIAPMGVEPPLLGLELGEEEAEGDTEAVTCALLLVGICEDVLVEVDIMAVLNSRTVVGKAETWPLLRRIWPWALILTPLPASQQSVLLKKQQ